MDERLLTEKLIGYETSEPEGIRNCAGFIKGWLEARGMETRQLTIRELPILIAETGVGSDTTIVIHGHIDVVPGREGQFEPRLEGDRLYGRGAYDMKGAVAAMMLAMADVQARDDVHVRLALVPDEESEEVDYRGSDVVVEQGFAGDFAITGEPTDMHVGVAAKGVLAVRLQVEGRAAHGSTPWQGDNAIVKAFDLFRTIESLPFMRESSELFDRPSINLGRILGGDAINKVPDTCSIDVDIRYLPDQEADEILAAIEALPDSEVTHRFVRPPISVDRDSLFVRQLCAAAGPNHDGEVTSVGRDGASDAYSFITAGTPAVEFGPLGAGHHGPDEWVSISSLAAYRRTLTDFVTGIGPAVEAASR